MDATAIEQLSIYFLSRTGGSKCPIGSSISGGAPTTALPRPRPPTSAAAVATWTGSEVSRRDFHRVPSPPKATRSSTQPLSTSTRYVEIVCQLIDGQWHVEQHVSWLKNSHCDDCFLIFCNGLVTFFLRSSTTGSGWKRFRRFQP